MAPWWKRHHDQQKVCSDCGGTEHVEHGLCRRCRQERGLDGSAHPGPASHAPLKEHVPDPVPLEPAHDRPWRHLGG